jgi:hypothetical protein
MTAPAVPTAPLARVATLRTLAAVEARRYARHPLFLIGVALLIYLTATESYAGFDARSGGSTFIPAFSLGVLGMFVAYGLTRSMAHSTEAVDTAPADGITRTAALCLACLVPGAVALAWVAWSYMAMSLWSATESAAISPVERAAIFAAAVVYAVGGPLVGVMVGRWTRFPGAGLLAAVALVGWSVLAGGGGLAMPASRLSNLVRLSNPFTMWDSSDGPGEPLWIAGGSPVWYLLYITLLCGLAATMAMLHEASGRQRSRLVRVLVILATLAITSLGLAVAADPTRVPL